MTIRRDRRGEGVGDRLAGYMVLVYILFLIFLAGAAWLDSASHGLLP
jgi:hypothetical protein